MAKKKKMTEDEEMMLDIANFMESLPDEELQGMMRVAARLEALAEKGREMVFDVMAQMLAMDEDVMHEVMSTDEGRTKLLQECGYDEERLKEVLCEMPDIDCGEDEDSDEEDEGEEGRDYPRFLPAVMPQKYTLRCTLRGIKPSIWRKLVVPSNITLRHLSELLIDLMGWGNYHLNQFRKGSDYYAPAHQRAYENDVCSPFDKYRNHSQEEFTIADLLSEKGKCIVLEYDFGDSWEHEVKLSSVEDYDDNEQHEIVFKGGKRACPPEDCGGIWGYEDLLALHAKRKAHKRLTSEERERLDWYGILDDFDPEYIDMEGCEEIAEDYNLM